MLDFPKEIEVNALDYKSRFVKFVQELLSIKDWLPGSSEFISIDVNLLF